MPTELTLWYEFAERKSLTPRAGFGPTLDIVRTTDASYFDDTGILRIAAPGEARFGHIPSTNESLGLLVEDPATNLLFQSEDLSTTWTNVGSTETINDTTSPDGTNNADKVVEDSATSDHLIRQVTAATLLSFNGYTVSVFVQAAERGFAFLTVSGAAFVLTGISINLSTGAVSTAVGSPLKATSLDLGNGWYRVSFDRLTAAADTAQIDIYASIDGVWANRSYLGDGSSGIFVWGAQLELSVFATSYIPTTTTAETRNADVVSTTDMSWIDVTQGTLAVAHRPLNPMSIQGNDYLIDITNTTLHSIQIIRATGITASARWRETAASAQLDRSASFLGGIESIVATAWQEDDFDAYVDGEQMGTPDISGEVPVTLNKLNIGCAENSTQQMNGYIRDFRYYNVRQPTDLLIELSLGTLAGARVTPGNRRARGQAQAMWAQRMRSNQVDGDIITAIWEYLNG